MKYNYPIKYAAMPIIEQIGWSHGLNELERKDGIVCYIVSKCYLLNDKIKYRENGQSEKEYEVVFPYQKDEYHNWERVTPSFNVFSHACTNGEIVEEVFDTYEKAIIFATKKNEELCKKTWINLAYTRDFHKQVLKKEEAFNKILSKYKVLEQLMLENMLDLEQSNVKELNALLRINENKLNVLNSSLYEYLNCSSYSKYVVYSISLEEYNKVLELVKNHEDPDIPKTLLNGCPILYHNHEINEKDIMVIDEEGNVIYYINEWETLVNNDVPFVKMSAIDEETQKIYTTETLEDIILSFGKHKSIDQNNFKGEVLKKSLREDKKGE